MTFLQNDFEKACLRVKRVVFQVVQALERMGISLFHDQTVFASTEDFRLIHGTWVAPVEVSLLLHNYDCVPFPYRAQPGALLLVGVLIDHLFFCFVN